MSAFGEINLGGFYFFLEECFIVLFGCFKHNYLNKYFVTSVTELVEGWKRKLRVVLPRSGLKIADRPDGTDFGLDRTA
jgi:hypothetical protein